MRKIEQNIINSFRLAKTDIIKTQKNLIEVSRNQEKMIEMLDSLKAQMKDLNEAMKREKTKAAVAKTSVKRSMKRKAQVYVAAKEGPKFHVEACPFAQNIIPKHKVTFRSQVAAKNAGKKPCACIRG